MSSKKFSYRLRFYLIGFGLGCVMVWAMFYKDNDRRLSTPQGLIFNFIESVDNIIVTDKAACQLDCYKIKPDFIDKAFLEEADVNFGSSATKRKPCPEYVITSVLPDQRKITIYMETCLNPCEGCDDSDKTATLRKIQITESESICDC